MSYALVRDQRNMALDTRRNQAYYEALKQVITPDSVVLDLGAGLGILGLLAAQLGAKQVYLVEPEDIIQVTKEIVQQNGYGDRVTCLKGKIEDIKLPEPVDVIISVFTGNFLLEEDLLPSLFYARDKYLKPEGKMIPQAAVIEAVPITAPEVYQKNIACWSEPHFKIDHSAARSYASQSIYYRDRELNNAEYLAQPAKLLEMNFYTCNSTQCEQKVDYTITKSGLCHGWVGWFTMQLGDKWFSTSPHEPPSHWSAAFLPLDPPLEFETGEKVQFKLQRPPFGDWSWQVKTNTILQQHSTFFSMPMSLKRIKQFSPQYQPVLNQKGQAAKYVLSHTDGNTSVEEISKQLVKKYPQVFEEPQKALNFVRLLIANFS